MDDVVTSKRLFVYIDKLSFINVIQEYCYVTIIVFLFYSKLKKMHFVQRIPMFTNSQCTLGG
jgi:hypothetical protein